MLINDIKDPLKYAQIYVEMLLEIQQLLEKTKVVHLKMSNFGLFLLYTSMMPMEVISKCAEISE